MNGPLASGPSGGTAKYASLDTHTPRLQPPLSVGKLRSHEIKNSKMALQVSATASRRRMCRT